MNTVISLRSTRLQRGFSLLELLVAFSIMAMALAMLYRASGSSVRNVADTAQYQRAVVLAESLLASKEAVDEAGWNESGQSAGFGWQSRSTPFVTAKARSDLQAVPLHAISVVVVWGEGGHQRQFELHTLRPQRKLPNAGLSK